MDLSATRLLPVDRETAWRALNDPAILQASIAGCESIEATGENEFAVAMVAAVGPVRAKFKGKLRLADVVAPERYTLVFEGQGGPAGFAKGTALVELTPEAGSTRLAYSVHAQVGGKLAQVGQRLIDAAARKVADDFFAAFSERLAPAPSPAAAPARPVFPAWAWIAAALALAAALAWALLAR